MAASGVTAAPPAGLRDTPFPLLWLNVFSYVLITSAERFTFVWLVMETLDGPSWASGSVLFALGLPVFFFVLPAGGLADRLDRRKLLMGTQLAGSAITLVAASLVRAGRMTVPLALVTAFMLGTAVAFGQPVRSSLVPTVVPRELLLRSIVLVTIGMNVAMIVGPFVGGIIIRRAGISVAFTVEAALFCFGFLTLIPLRLPTRAPHTEAFSVAHLKASIREGLRFVWHHELLRPLFGMLTVGGFLMMGASNLLVPQLARDVFGADADSASRLYAYMGVGLTATSLVLLRRGRSERPGRVFLVGMVVGTSVQTVMSAAPSYWSLAAMLTIWGACGGVYLNLNQSLIQAATPAETMGRIMSLHTLCQAGLAPIGSLLAGVLSGMVGPRAAMASYGALGVVAAVTMLRRADALRHSS